MAVAAGVGMDRFERVVTDRNWLTAGQHCLLPVVAKCLALVVLVEFIQLALEAPWDLSDLFELQALAT